MRNYEKEIIHRTVNGTLKTIFESLVGKELKENTFQVKSELTTLPTSMDTIKLS